MGWMDRKQISSAPPVIEWRVWFSMVPIKFALIKNESDIDAASLKKLLLYTITIYKLKLKKLKY